MKDNSVGSVSLDLNVVRPLEKLKKDNIAFLIYLQYSDNPIHSIKYKKTLTFYCAFTALA